MKSTNFLQAVKAGILHDLAVLWHAVRVSLLVVIVLAIAVVSLAGIRAMWIGLTAERSDCATFELSEKGIENIRKALEYEKAPSIAPSSSADDQKRETEAERLTTTPEQKTP